MICHVPPGGLEVFWLYPPTVRRGWGREVGTTKSPQPFLYGLTNEKRPSLLVGIVSSYWELVNWGSCFGFFKDRAWLLMFSGSQCLEHGTTEQLRFANESWPTHSFCNFMPQWFYRNEMTRTFLNNVSNWLFRQLFIRHLQQPHATAICCMAWWLSNHGLQDFGIYLSTMLKLVGKLLDWLQRWSQLLVVACCCCDHLCIYIYIYINTLTISKIMFDDWCDVAVLDRCQA